MNDRLERQLKWRTSVRDSSNATGRSPTDVVGRECVQYESKQGTSVGAKGNRYTVASLLVALASRGRRLSSKMRSRLSVRVTSAHTAAATEYFARR